MEEIGVNWSRDPSWLDMGIHVMQFSILFLWDSLGNTPKIEHGIYIYPNFNILAQFLAFEEFPKRHEFFNNFIIVSSRRRSHL